MRVVAVLWSLLVTVLAWPSLARAGSQLTVEFAVAPDVRPKHVCVLHQRSTKPPASASSLLLESTPEIAGLSRFRVPVAADEVSRKLWRISSPALRPWFDELTGDWYVLDPDLGGPPKAILKAFAALAGSGKPADKGGACGEGKAPCIGEFTTGDAQFLTCVENSQDTGVRERVAVITIARDTQPIMDLALNGTTLTISHTADLTGEADLSVAGGHYVRGFSTSSTAARAHLTLRPSCVEHRVALPPLITSTAQACVQLDYRAGAQNWSCRRQYPKGELISALVPEQSGQLHGAIAASGVEECSDASSVPLKEDLASLVSQWDDVVPQQLEMRLLSISMRWRVSCLYPETPLAEHCPTARLPDAGLTCSPNRWNANEGVRGVCEYMCVPSTSEPGKPFSLPIHASFSAGVQGDSWTDTVDAIGKTLGGYADRETRQLTVDFKQWSSSSTKHTADAIHDVTVKGPSGQTFRFVPSVGSPGAQRIVLPGATCDDVVFYQVEGERYYREGYVRITDGRIDVPNPTITARVFGVGLRLGPALLVSPVSGLRSTPGFALELGVRWLLLRERRTSTMSLEWHSEYLLSGQWYRPLDANVAAAASRAAYNRVFSSFGPMFAMSDQFWAGFTLGSGVGWAVFDSDQHLVGSPQIIPVVGSLLARYRIARLLSLDAAGRVFSETVYAYNDGGPNRFRGTPAPSDSYRPVFLIELALRGWL